MFQIPLDLDHTDVFWGYYLSANESVLESPTFQTYTYLQAKPPKYFNLYPCSYSYASRQRAWKMSWKRAPILQVQVNEKQVFLVLRLLPFPLFYRKTFVMCCVQKNPLQKCRLLGLCLPSCLPELSTPDSFTIYLWKHLVELHLHSACPGIKTISKWSAGVQQFTGPPAVETYYCKREELLNIVEAFENPVCHFTFE